MHNFELGSNRIIILLNNNHTGPPNDVCVSDINPNQFAIDWSPPANYCPVTTYNITTTDCGVCPNTTSNTSIMCTILAIDGQVCSVIIQTKACGVNYTEYSGTANLTIELRGNYSMRTLILVINILVIIFGCVVPSAPKMTARWANQFSSIFTSFNKTVRSYTIIALAIPFCMH